MVHIGGFTASIDFQAVKWQLSLWPVTKLWQALTEVLMQYYLHMSGVECIYKLLEV